MTPDREKLHLKACSQGDLTYSDPRTGYPVFTALALERRGDCCGCGCRHCPYGHQEVTPDERAMLHRDPWIEGDLPKGPVDLLFWSGGKDSYLTLRALEREAARPTVLLTTFDGRSEQVAHQEVLVQEIRHQRKRLGCAQVLVPLFPGTGYMDRVLLGIQTLQFRTPVARLVFGDLHLDHVRTWREDAFSACSDIASIPIHLPLWGVPYEELLNDLESAPVQARVSAVADESCAQVISVGDLFNRDLIARLPNGIDEFGENGEFHSCIEFLPKT
ncbi:MAG: hypothetical protein CMH50_11165 [Myxococcales bacterium]|nr:hypothetical protein [Myxococcales bacterium]